MAYTLKYFHKVETHLLEAKTWYKEQKEGLEIEFSADIKKALQLIIAQPQTYSVRYKKIRIAHPKNFLIISIFRLMNPI